MINLFDSFFASIRNKTNEIVYPFHVTFMTSEESSGDFDASYLELDDPFDSYTHYGLFKSKASQRLFAMPMTAQQVTKQTN